MPIYNIPINNIENSYSWDITEERLAAFSRIDDYQSFVEETRGKNQSLREIEINTILDFIDSLANYWMSAHSQFMKKYSKLGVSFLLNFIRRTNLERLLNISLRGNIGYLDNFKEVPQFEKRIMAQPRGIITHWLAGNVPILGMISFISGLLSKNINIIKLPQLNGLVLPAMLADMKEHNYRKTDGQILQGNQLIESVKFVYCQRDDLASHKMLSLNTDVRVAWGGREAIETVLALPKHYGTEDVIFGPKYSFAVVGRNSFDPKDLDEITYKLALDASVFEQRGCNSPHTVIVEEGGQVSPLDFAKALALGFAKVIKRIPKESVSAEEAYKIVNIRSNYELSGEVFASRGTEWTVIYSDEEGLADACFSRILFVRPISDIFNCVSFVDKYRQTLGLLIDEERKTDFARAVTVKGIERVTELGMMSTFDYPWDGMFPIDRFVRWVSLS